MRLMANAVTTDTIRTEAQAAALLETIRPFIQSGKVLKVSPRKHSLMIVTADGSKRYLTSTFEVVSYQIANAG